MKTKKEDATYFANLERTAVEMFKNNCSKIEITDVNRAGLRYLLEYINSFNRYPEITIFTANEDIELNNISSKYKGNILFIKKTN